MSTDGTGEESVAAGAGKGTNNERDNFRVSNKAMLGEIWNILKERDIGRHKMLCARGIIASVSFLSFRISNRHI